MAESPQSVLPPEPWYESPVTVRMVAGGLAQIMSLLMRLLHAFGVDVKVEQVDIDAIAADGAQAVALVFFVWALIKRKNSTVQPLTLTRAAADDLTRTKPPLLDSDPTKEKRP